MSSVLDLGNLLIRISADSTVADTVQARFLANVDRTAANLERAGARMSVAITAPLALAGRAVAKTILSFDQSMTKALSIMGNAGDGMRQKMESAARALSRETIHGPEELASAYFHLAQAGLSAQQAMASLKPVANFATGAMMSLEDATQLLITSQSALGLASADPAKQLANLEHVSNVLTKAANLTTASQQSLGTALASKSAAAARILGKDIEETVAVLSTFAKVGVQAETAGERLDIIWRDLGKAVSTHGADWAKLGLAVYDVNGKFRNTADILEDVDRVLKPLSDEQKTLTLATLGFQYRSVSAVKQLLGLHDVMREYERQLRSTGAETDRLANTQMTSMSNKLKNLSARFGDAKLQLEDDFRGALEKVIDTGQSVIEFWNRMDASERRFIAVTAVVAASAGPVVFIFGQLAFAAKNLFSVTNSLIGGTRSLGTLYGSLRSSFTGFFSRTASEATSAAAATMSVAAATERVSRATAGISASRMFPTIAGPAAPKRPTTGMGDPAQSMRGVPHSGDAWRVQAPHLFNPTAAIHAENFGTPDAHIQANAERMARQNMTAQNALDSHALRATSASSRLSGLTDVDRMRPAPETRAQQAASVLDLNKQAGAKTFRSRMNSEMLGSANDGFRSVPSQAAKAQAALTAFGKTAATWSADKALPRFTERVSSGFATLALSVNSAASSMVTGGAQRIERAFGSIGGAFSSLKSAATSLPSMLGGGLSRAFTAATSVASAFKFELFSLAVYGIAKVAGKLYDVVAGTEQFNAAMEKGKELSGAMNSGTQRRQQRTLTSISSIEDSGQRKSAFAAELARAQKNVEGLKASLKGAQKNLSEFSTIGRTMVGDWQIEVLTAEIGETKDQLKGATEYVESLRDALQQSDIQARQAAASMRSVGGSEIEANFNAAAQSIERVTDAMVSVGDDIALLEMKLQGIPDELAKGFQQIAQLQGLGAPPQAIAQLDAMIQKRYALNQQIEQQTKLEEQAERVQSQMHSDAEQLVESLATPLEKLQKKLEHLQTLKSGGFIGPETFDRGVTQAGKEAMSDADRESGPKRKEFNPREGMQWVDNTQKNVLALQSGGPRGQGGPEQKSEQHLAVIKSGIQKLVANSQKSNAPGANKQTPKIKGI